MDLTDARQEFSRYCQRMYDKGLVHATAGNVSLKLDDTLLISPSGFCLGDVQPDDVVILDQSGSIICDKSNKPSSEWRIHQKIYTARDDIGAVMHAHPPKATALALAGIALDEYLLAEVIIMLGKVPLLPYILPGSEALANAVFEAMKEHHALLLANHGVFTTGETFQQAYYRMELVETLAEMVIYAQLMGGTKKLSQTQAEEICSTTGHQLLHAL